MAKNKVISLQQLFLEASNHRKRKQSVVLCHGTFDLFHAGHMKHLQKAALEGDALFVTITSDHFVNKGPGRPVFGEELRAETIAALECVSFVAINPAETSTEVIKLLRPAVYVKGNDYLNSKDDLTGNIDIERDAIEEVGGRIVYTNEVTFSSSNLLNQYFDVFSPDTKSYLSNLSENYDASEIISKLKSLANKKVLVFGDAIIDQYHYVEMLGHTGKGNSLAVRFGSEEQFAGGSIAVANHVAAIAENTYLLTAAGEQDSSKDFIRSTLISGVQPNLFSIEGRGTLTKRRFVDHDLNKLFEVYFDQLDALPKEVESSICAWLKENLDSFDIVLVPDFGNGLITDQMIKVLCDRSQFLAVNTQINSGNRGHHVVTRYPRADYISLNEPELRLAMHNRYDPLERLVEQVAERMDANYVAITRGVDGLLFYNHGNGSLINVPALSSKVLDRVGAGDAFLSFSSLCIGSSVGPEISAFVGSAAAALDVQIIGNRETVGSVGLFKYINTLLK